MNRTLTSLALSVAILAVGSANAGTVELTPMLLPGPGSKSLVAAQEKALANYFAGTLQGGSVKDPTTPVAYGLCNGQISLYNLIYAENNVPMWNGVLNPSVQFREETGWVVWTMVVAKSANGGDTISPEMLNASFSSLDGALNEGNANSFGYYGNNAFGDYTTVAVGIKADGSRVTSGPPSQLVATIVLFVHSPLFNGGGTQSGIDEVENYVQGYIRKNGKYSLTYTAKIKGDDSSLATSTVFVTNGAAVPVLAIERGGFIRVVNGKVGDIYRLYRKDAVNATGSGSLIGTLTGNSQFQVPMNAPAAFFSVTRQ